MHPEFQQLMSQATQLTRAGNLAEATAAIQAALRGVQPAGRSDAGFSTQTFSRPFAQPAVSPYDGADVIDVEARVIPDSANSSSAAPASATDDHVTAPVRKPSLSGDTFTSGSFRNAAGLRHYKLYVPPGAGDKSMPLVVMLHGCTQDADDFAAGTAMNDAAREQGFYVLYPVQSREANPQKCWNWFKHNHQEAGRGEPSILAGMTREIMASHNIDPRRVYVAGLSAGGAMAAILGRAYPELFAAAGVHSGLAAGVAKDLPSALSAMNGAGNRTVPPGSSAVPTIVFHGDRDATVHPGNADTVVAASAGASARAESQRVAGLNSKRDSTKRVYRNQAGDVVAEYWTIHGAGHAWAGGTERGSYTDRAGPDATAEMLRFFFEHPLAGKP